MARVPTAPAATSIAVRAVMQGNRRRDTTPERALRSSLHRLGLRFRVDRKIGIGRSAPRQDLVFPTERVAVFVDGCFWHGCPSHGVQPRANTAYWTAKLQANRDRDERNTNALEALGWRVVRVWEHEQPDEAAETVQAAVISRRRLVVRA